MGQFVIIIIAFLSIPILNKLKLNLGTSILGAGLILGILSRIGLSTFGSIVIGVFTETASVDTILTVAIVGILGGLMKHYNLLDRIVDSMLNIINDKKLILMVIPPMMGMLSIPGGAALSAPFINNMGDELEISPVRRTAINLVFRHISLFFLPYGSSLLLIQSSLPQLNIYKFIMLNSILIIGILVSGYFLYVRKVKSIKVERKSSPVKEFLRLILLTSPIYISVLIDSMTNFPFFISMLFSILCLYFLSDRKGFLGQITKSMNWDAIVTVTGILIIKDIILNMDELILFIEKIFAMANNQFVILGIFMFVAMFFGFITGNSSVPMAVTLPFLIMMNLPLNKLYVYIFFLFASGFYGYYFSPIHLCQILTIQEMGTNIFDLYKEYRWYALINIGILVISTSILLIFV